MADRKAWMCSIALFAFGLLLNPANAETGTDVTPKWSAKAAFHPPAATTAPAPALNASKELSASREWIFSAPPRGAAKEEQAIYQPIVEFLSRTTGHKIVYKYSDNWLSYSKDMSFGQYDIVFDGPHFNGWRQDKLQHTPLLKLPDDMVFVVVSRADDAAVKDLKQLAGRRVCAHAPPNLGTLTMLSRFENPARQPVIVETQGWDGGYKGMLAGKCVGTVLPIKNLKKFDGDKNAARILYQHRALPNQAISAGPAVPVGVQVKIANALLSEEGRQITQKLLDAYAAKSFVPATREEYAGLGMLLKDTLYYQ